MLSYLRIYALCKRDQKVKDKLVKRMVAMSRSTAGVKHRASLQELGFVFSNAEGVNYETIISSLINCRFH